MTVLSFIIVILFTLAGAVWRFLDGMDADDSRLPTAVRNAGTVCLAVAAAWSAGFGWWSVWAGGWAACSLIVGQTDWRNLKWQAIRFGGLAALAVLPVGMAGLPAVALAALGGAAYWALAKIDARLPKFWQFDGFEAYARLALGAGTIGGLAVSGIFI